MERQGDINILALCRHGERYILVFRDSQRDDALRTIGRWASNPELSFSWHDAAVLSQRIRQQAIDQPPKPKKWSVPWAWLFQQEAHRG